jgi:hypothetical protein
MDDSKVEPKAERTASEVLLQIESRQEIILRYLKNLDMNIKLIYNRLGISAFPSLEPTKQPVSVPPKQPSNLSTNKPVHPTVSAETFIQNKGNREKKVIPSATFDMNKKKRTINQKVYYKSDAKGVLLASVEAFDSNGNSAGKTRTGMTGVWTLSLRDGSYRVHITKSGASGRPPVKEEFNLDVNENVASLEDLSI